MVRVATPDDIEGIVSVREAYCHALKEHYLELAPHDPESTRFMCRKFFAMPSTVILVGECEGVIMGTLMLMVLPYPINNAVTMAMELMLFVKPEARSQGLGSQLFEAGEQWAKARGAAFLIVSYRAGLESAEWFEKRGYVPMEPTMVKRLED